MKKKESIKQIMKTKISLHIEKFHLYIYFFRMFTSAREIFLYERTVIRRVFRITGQINFAETV